MNGYSRAEEIALGVRGAATRCEIPHSGRGESPIFVFSSGRAAGADELAKALAASCTFTDDSYFSPQIIDALARQLIAAGFAEATMDAAAPDAPSPCLRDRRIDDVIKAQTRFVKEICSGLARRGGTELWGTVQYDLPGEYAVYLRFLFPAARILFLRRSPADAYQSFLTQPSTRFPHNPALATSFQKHCAQLAAGFERWCSEANGLLIDYERLPSEDAEKAEEYLGVRLSDEARALWRSRQLAADTAAVANEAGDAHLHFLTPLSERQTDEKASGVPTPRRAERAAAGGPESCAVLVPISRYVEPECEESLRALERRGYAIRKLHGCSAVDAARNTLATRALDEGFDETLWVDADVAFDADAVDRLRSHGLPISSGIYPKKGFRELATGLLPGTPEVVFGDEGELIEILYAGAGFLHVRREVYESIRDRLALPTCNAWSDRRAIPFFMPMIEQWGDRFAYLAEDYGFCRRARQCGFKIFADTSIRLWHIGSYRYGYEDASGEINRGKTHRYRPASQS